MKPNPTPIGITLPPGADTCPGGDILPAAGVPLAPTDFHPHARTAQLAKAEAIFNNARQHSDKALYHACQTIIDLSREHALRQRAQDLLRFLKD